MRVRRRRLLDEPEPHAEQFAPHQFLNRVERLHHRRFPEILVSPRALHKMWHYVDIAEGEVAWLGTAVPLPDTDDFLIDDVFLVQQEVSVAVAILTPDGLAELASELISQGEEGEKTWSNLRFWGHSHARMNTVPSLQDERQMVEFERLGVPWFIRGILNKLGQIEFTIDLFSEGVRIVDAPWRVYSPTDMVEREAIAAEFKAKVRPRRFGLSGRSFLTKANTGGVK